MANIDVKRERFREFLAESEDILNSMGKGLLKLGKGIKAGIIDPAVLNGIFRSAHTLKGMSGVFDFAEMTSLSHALEDTLDLLRMGRIVLTDDILYAVMATHELMLRIVASGGESDFTSEIETTKNNLSRTCQTKKQKTESGIGKEFLSILTEYEAHRFRENLRDGRNIFLLNAGFAITRFDKGYVALTDLLKTESEVIATLPSSRTDREMLFFDILIGSSRDRHFIRDLSGKVAEADVKVISEGTPVPQGLPGMEPALELVSSKDWRHRKPQRETLRRSGNSVRVNIGKLDNIMNIVSELFILKRDIASLGEELKRNIELSGFGSKLSRTEKLLDRKLFDLRNSILDVRMVPIGQLFSRFETFINKLSSETGKEIRIVTHGDETEIDKLIIEELADPLMHIIMNVVDHGIEPASVRDACGKIRAGTIALNAYQKGKHVIVEVKDDGAGIDEDFVREKTVEKGIVSADGVKKLSRQEIIELIFMPGFSTRDAVTETSGRGVGLDVVKENIGRIGGIIDVDTVKGKGTRFILTIPITLAIIQALIVEDCGERYAVPFSSLGEIIELRDDPGSDGSVDFVEKITVNGRIMPSVRLSRFFDKKSADDGNVRYGIIVGLAEHRLCVIVDRLVEELDVVVKPLSRLLKIPGIAGAADMGDKGTMLVLDVPGILEQALKESKSILRN